jgi:hypothetical protein
MLRFYTFEWKMATVEHHLSNERLKDKPGGNKEGKGWKEKLKKNSHNVHRRCRSKS